VQGGKGTQPKQDGKDGEKKGGPLKRGGGTRGKKNIRTKSPGVRGNNRSFAGKKKQKGKRAMLRRQTGGAKQHRGKKEAGVTTAEVSVSKPKGGGRSKKRSEGKHRIRAPPGQEYL